MYIISRVRGNIDRRSVLNPPLLREIYCVGTRAFREQSIFFFLRPYLVNALRYTSFVGLTCENYKLIALKTVFET